MGSILAASEPMEGRMEEAGTNATFLDGTSNRRRDVTVRAALDLEIAESGQIIARWPWDTIRRADKAHGALRFRSTQGPDLARLDVTDPAFARTIEAYCPNLGNSGVIGRTSTARIVLWSIAAAFSLLLVGLYGVPYAADKLAPLLPQSFDDRLGDVVDGQVRTIFGNRTCEAPDGVKAYQKLVSKLAEAGALKAPLKAAVLDSGVKNAVALPGGKVYFFKGLLQQAKSPDEVAGVLAHELGHVHHRDSMRKLLQAGGTSFLLGLLFGDVTGAGAVIIATRTLLDKSYSREAEYRADGYAIETMRKLGRSAAPMGELLVRITGANGKSRFTILASHPFSGARLERMKKAMAVHTGEPLLSAAEWEALKAICSKTSAGTTGKKQ